MSERCGYWWPLTEKDIICHKWQLEFQQLCCSLGRPGRVFLRGFKDLKACCIQVLLRPHGWPFSRAWLCLGGKATNGLELSKSFTLISCTVTVLYRSAEWCHCCPTLSPLWLFWDVSSNTLDTHADYQKVTEDGRVFWFIVLCKFLKLL